MKTEPTQSSPRRQREKADVGEHHRDAEALPGAESVAQKDDRKEKSRQRFRAVQKSHDDGGQVFQPAHVAIEGEDGAENDDEAERRRYMAVQRMSSFQGWQTDEAMRPPTRMLHAATGMTPTRRMMPAG